MFIRTVLDFTSQHRSQRLTFCKEIMKYHYCNNYQLIQNLNP